MGQFDIDKYFRSRIKDHTEELDTDALWASLNLEEKKKDRGIFWLTGFLAVLIFVGSIVYFSTQNWEETQENNIFTQKEKTIKNEKTTNSILLELNNKEAKTKTNSEAKTEIETKTNFEFKTKTPTSTDRQIVPIEIAANENAITDKLKNTAQISPSKFTTTNNLDANKLTDSSISTTSDTENSADKLLSETTENLLIQTKQFENKQLNKSSSKTTKLAANEYADFTIAPLALLPTLDIGAITSLNKFKTISIPDCNFINPLKRKKSKISIHVNGGYSMIQRNLTSLGESEFDRFIDTRNNSESLLEAIELGTELRYKLRSGLYAKVGVQYQSINEEFNWSSRSRDTIAVENTVHTRYVSAQNDTTRIVGPGLATAFSEKKWLNYNQHRFINIPISLGYEINRGPWSLFVEGSFHFNILNKFTGKQLDRSATVTSEPDYLTTSAKHSYGFSAGIGYQLNERINIYAQPHYQSFLGSFTTEASNIDQRYKLYGIKMGVGYLLN